MVRVCVKSYSLGLSCGYLLRELRRDGKLVLGGWRGLDIYRNVNVIRYRN